MRAAGLMWLSPVLWKALAAVCFAVLLRKPEPTTAGGKRRLRLGLDSLRFSQRWDVAAHRFSVGPSGQGENLGLVTKNNFYNKELLRETELFRVCCSSAVPAGGRRL